MEAARPRPATADDALLFEALTESIIGCAITVHKVLGVGFLEQVYENALVIEFERAGLEVRQQVHFDVRYAGRVVGNYVADLVVEDKVIVEVKAVPEVNNVHKAQLLNYLAATGVRVGLILNFGETRMRPTRLIR